MAKMPSKQQARWLRSLPILHSHLMSMNGNHARTVYSLQLAGWAVWDGPTDERGRVYKEFGTLKISPAGLEVLAHYTDKLKMQRIGWVVQYISPKPSPKLAAIGGVRKQVFMDRAGAEAFANTLRAKDIRGICVRMAMG